MGWPKYMGWAHPSWAKISPEEIGPGSAHRSSGWAGFGLKCIFFFSSHWSGLVNNRELSIVHLQNNRGSEDEEEKEGSGSNDLAVRTASLLSLMAAHGGAEWRHAVVAAIFFFSLCRSTSLCFFFSLSVLFILPPFLFVSFSLFFFSLFYSIFFSLYFPSLFLYSFSDFLPLPSYLSFYFFPPLLFFVVPPCFSSSLSLWSLVPLSSLSFFPSLAPPFSSSIYNCRGRGSHPTLSNHGAGGTRATLPLSSHEDRVRWLGRSCTATPESLAGHGSLAPYIIVVGHDECGLCRVWTSGEREGAGKYKEENLLLHLPMRVQGKKKTHIAIKNDIVLAFFLWTVHETTLVWTKHAVSFKRKWRQKSQFSNQSSICDLFNQVLNCNFHFKNHFNCILVEFKCQPWCWLPFSFWSLILDLRN